MALELSTAPTLQPLSLGEVMAHLAVTDADESEAAYIQALMDAATSYCESHLNRQLLTATWVWTLESFPSWELELPRAPLQSISSIVYLDSDGDSTTLSSSLYRVDTPWQASGRIEPAYGETWPSTYGVFDAVAVTFVAGWTANNLIPAAIRQGLKMLIGHWYENREAVGASMAEMPMATSACWAPWVVWDFSDHESRLA